MLLNRPDPDHDTEDEDPWSWDVAQPAAAGRKKRQTQRMSLSHPECHHSAIVLDSWLDSVRFGR